MKFGNFEIPPKKKEEKLSFKEQRDILYNFEINPSILIQKAIDDNGYIVNCSDLFSSLLYSGLKKEMGNKNFEELYEDSLYSSELSVPLFWKNLESHKKFSSLINDNFFDKDIEKIIAIQFIRDVENQWFSESEGDTYHVDDLTKSNLMKKVLSPNATLLEKIFLKEVIFNITKNDTLYVDESKRNEIFYSLEKEIGGNIDLSNFYDKNLSKFDFDFTEFQEDFILSDSENGFHDEFSLLHHVKIDKIQPKDKDPWVLKDYYISGDYINSKLAPGLLGVYSRSGRLVGWREINELDFNKKNNIEDVSSIKKRFPDISVSDIALFRVASSLYFRDYIQNNIGVNLSNLSLENQLYFLNFIQGKTEDDLINFKKFIKSSETEKDKENKFKSFLSIEKGGKEMGDKILSLGEKLPHDIAQKVFEKYREIIETADKVEEKIKNIFGDKDIPSKVLISIKETLLKRGAQMLSDLGDKVLEPKFEVNEIEILKELDEIKEETLILGKSYVELYKEGIRVPIDEVTTTKETPTENLSENQKKELIKIYEKGRPKVTYENKEHLDLLKNEFEEELNNKSVSVTEICFKNETIIIALIDKKDQDNDLYIGGLTFVEEVKNAVVAEATMSHVLEKFKDKNIKALVDSRNPLLNMYLKRFGFKIVKELPREENAGELYYEIERPIHELKTENKLEGTEKLQEAA